MLLYVIEFIVIIAIVVTCDFTPYTLTDEEVVLLYSDETTSDNSNDTIFGTSTITGEINTNDIMSSDKKQQAEDLLNKIYNG